MRSRPGHWFRGRSFRICSGRKRQRRRRRRRARPFGHRRVRSLRENTGNTVVNASFKSKAKRGTGCAQRGCLFIVLSQHRDPGGKKRKCFLLPVLYRCRVGRVGRRRRRRRSESRGHGAPETLKKSAPLLFLRWVAEPKCLGEQTPKQRAQVTLRAQLCAKRGRR
jgi:hypothetical protein